MGPTAIARETTTIPISESVPCQAAAARAPEQTRGRTTNQLVNAFRPRFASPEGFLWCGYFTRDRRHGVPTFPAFQRAPCSALSLP
jgi:hypothetical protein